MADAPIHLVKPRPATVAEAVVVLCEVDVAVWKKLAMQVGWHFRTQGVKPLPPMVAALFGGSVEREIWDKVREGISEKRRHDRYQEEVHKVQQRRDARRRYMRNYMRTYRAEGKA